MVNGLIVPQARLATFFVGVQIHYKDSLQTLAHEKLKPLAGLSFSMREGRDLNPQPSA